ncbi:MAG: hypothetical protein GX808_12630 [Syntrophomonadaceae bacterium]|jgi:uncharacterized protein YdaL|nr:hypothetical protein [Syntrophomonadaceae bacterium]
MNYDSESLFEILTNYAVEVGLLDNKDEIIVTQETQKDLISAIVDDVSNSKISDFNGRNPFHLSFKYVFSKGFELAVLTDEFGAELYCEHTDYNYEDLLEDRCGLAADKKWIPLIDITLSLYINGLYDSYQQYVTTAYSKSKDVDTWSIFDQALRVINILGITFGKRCIKKRKPWQLIRGNDGRNKIN